MSSIRPRHRSVALLPLLPLAAAACININTKGYPLVERSEVRPLVAAAGDTAWVISRDRITVVGRSREGIDVPAGLTGVARGWERMFGASPGPATVVLVTMPDRKGRVPAPIVLPDSLATRTVVYVPTMRWDDGDRERRMMMPMGGGPGAMAPAPVASGGGAALQLAQAWLDARLIREPSAAMVPAWLRAGLVDALGGSEGGLLMGRRGRADAPRLPLDSLLARECPAGWSPIVRWQPRPPTVEDSVGAAERRARRAAEIRNGESDRDRERGIERAMQAPCGPMLRVASGSFLRYLMERGGDPMADRLLQTYLKGGTLTEAVAGAPGLPQSTPELERAWRAWEQERIEDLRRSAGR